MLGTIRGIILIIIPTLSTEVSTLLVAMVEDLILSVATVADSQVVLYTVLQRMVSVIPTSIIIQLLLIMVEVEVLLVLEVHRRTLAVLTPTILEEQVILERL